MNPLHWPFYAALAAGYLMVVGLLVREVWAGFRHGRTGLYKRAGLLATRRVEYLHAETPWKFRLALAANVVLLAAALVFLGLMANWLTQ